MHDGTWRKGEHWFKRQGSRALFSWPRIVAWLTLAEEPPREDVGTAYSGEIPLGRRRRRSALTMLRKNDPLPADGEDGPAPGIPKTPPDDGAP